MFQLSIGTNSLSAGPPFFSL